MEAFKLPDMVPQDLLIIQDIVGSPPPAVKAVAEEKVVADKKILDDRLGSDAESSSASDSESASEDEVDELVGVKQKHSGSSSDDVSSKMETMDDSTSAPPPEASSDSSSDSDSEPDEAPPTRKLQLPAEFDDDEEGGGPSGINAAAGLKSTNEQDETDAHILVPVITYVGQDEVLEHVGEIMTVTDRSVIVRGVATKSGAANAHALDVGSLLVFEDRKVLGHIHDTFGPTFQPFYAIKFPSGGPSLNAPVEVPVLPSPGTSDMLVEDPVVASSEPKLESTSTEPTGASTTPTIVTEEPFGDTPIPPTSVEEPSNDTPIPPTPPPVSEPEPAPEPASSPRTMELRPSPYVVNRPVFHVPQRSNFVFVEQLKRLKGSDASNVHDEEPSGGDQVDFSDDEEEARYKRSLKSAGEKRKRGESMGPGHVQPYSRGQTPSQMHDQDVSLSARTAPIVDSDSFYSLDPYAAPDPYDVGYTNGAASSSNNRTLLAYDDPYADSTDRMDTRDVSSKIDDLIASASASASTSSTGLTPSMDVPSSVARPSRGRGRGRGGFDGGGGFEGGGRGGFDGGSRGGSGGGGRGGGDRDRDRGRGRGHGRGNDFRGRGRGRGGSGGGGGDGYRQDRQQRERRPSISSDHAPPTPQRREISPTSAAIARATGQGAGPGQDQGQGQTSNSGAWGQSQPQPQGGMSFQQQQAWHPGFAGPGVDSSQFNYGFNAGYGYGQPQQVGFGMPMQYPNPQHQQQQSYQPQQSPQQQQHQQQQQQQPVQPHINPRFAAQWGWPGYGSGAPGWPQGGGMPPYGGGPQNG